MANNKNESSLSSIFDTETNKSTDTYIKNIKSVNSLSDIIDKNSVSIKNVNQITEEEKDELNHFLEGVDIVNENNNYVLDNVTMEGDNDLSKDQEKQEDKIKGKFKDKNGILLFWGFLVCACVLSTPLGGGFAFLLTPAQLSSFALIPFFKKTKKRVYVLDKEKSNANDKLVVANNGKGSADKALTVANKENIEKSLPEGYNYAKLSEKYPNLNKELWAFSTILHNISDKAFDKMLKAVSNEVNENICEALKDSKLSEKLEILSDGKNKENKAKIAEDIAKDFENSFKKMDDLKDFRLPDTKEISKIVEKESKNIVEKYNEVETYNKMLEAQKQSEQHQQNPIKLPPKSKKADSLQI